MAAAGSYTALGTRRKDKRSVERRGFVHAQVARGLAHDLRLGNFKYTGVALLHTLALFFAGRLPVGEAWGSFSHGRDLVSRSTLVRALELMMRPLRGVPERLSRAAHVLKTPNGPKADTLLEYVLVLV
jgi:hypothetical protein